MARVTQPYKNTGAHRQRAISTESQFTSGMKYTHAPLGDGYARLLVNYKLHNDGDVLTPRGGATQINRVTQEPYKLKDENAVVYYSGNVYVEEPSPSTDINIHRAIIWGYQDADGALVDGLTVTIENSIGALISKTYTLTSNVTMRLYMHNGASKVHDAELNNGNLVRTPVAAELDGILYSMCVSTINNVTSTYLAYHYFKWGTDEGSLTWTINSVVPKEPTPSLTINYGYNMLSPTPYSFSNYAGTSLRALGIVPYAPFSTGETPKLLLNARMGQEIWFKLVFEYPAEDVGNNKTYKVQWEIQDNEAGTSAVVISRWSECTAFNQTNDVYFKYKPSSRNFTVICKLYDTDTIQDQTDEWNEDENLHSLCKLEDFITPETVTTIASYRLTDETDTTARNLDASYYNLTTATGMIAWNKRLVLWGVRGCENAMWVSEINDPTYFPYPNNIELFDGPIIKIVTYLSDMLVFTRTAIYKVSLNEDGLSFKINKVQDNLNMTADDCTSIIAIQNMVFFRSNNYYFLLVPQYSVNTGTYGVQIAPISRPMEEFFDNFSTSCMDIINKVYGIVPSDTLTDLDYPMSTSYNWYTCYLAGTEIHNVVNVTVGHYIGTNYSAVTDGTFNISIIYDTVLRAWTLAIEEASVYPPYVYYNSSTGDTVFAKPHEYNSSRSIDLYLYRYDEKQLEDSLVLDNSTEVGYTYPRAVQYIDTGVRDFAEDLKKRFREVQFCIDILKPNSKLKFSTGFICDDAVERGMYRWIVEPTDVISNYQLDVSRELLDESEVCTEDYTKLDFWELDSTQFPDTTMCKIRYHVCGKGYNGSAQILSHNNVPYALKHISFVYRQMFAR